MAREFTRVRVVSFVAATLIGVAAIALADLRIPPPPPPPDVWIGVPVAADLSPRPVRETPPPPPRAIASAAPSAIAVRGERDNSLHLWRYGANGTIVFAYAEQYDRCVDARRKHIDQADCPGSRDTHAYVLDQSGNAPLVLSYRRH